MIQLNPQWFTILLTATEPRDSLPMFDLARATFMQMLPHLISFIVLAFIFSKLLYKPVKNILQARAERIESDIKEAAENKTSATELKNLYDQKIKDIEVERNIILDEARKEAAARLNQILGDARAEAGDIRERANRDIIAEKERVRTEVYQAIVDISTDMAAKLVSATIDQQAQDRLFAEAIDELEATVFRPF